MNTNKAIYITRLTGSISLFLDETKFSNAISIEYWIYKRFYENGYKIYINDYNLSRVAKNRLSGKESYNKDMYGWIEDAVEVITDNSFITRLPEEVKYVLCSQGPDNMLSLNSMNIPDLFMFWRMIRDCRVPIIYLQLDATTKLNLRHWNNQTAYVGFTIEELIKSNIVNVFAGSNISNRIIDNTRGYYFDNDLHCLAIPIVSELKKSPQESPENKIQFLGKGLRDDWRRKLILGIGEELNKASSSCVLELAGEWGEVPDIPSIRVLEPAAGLFEILERYNNSKYGLLIGNQEYYDVRQYTIRVFEVIAGGTIPLIHKPWWNTLKNLFTLETSTLMENFLLFDNPSDVPSVIDRIESRLKDRIGFIKSIQDSLLAILSEEVVSKEFNNLLEFCDTPKVEASLSIVIGEKISTLNKRSCVSIGGDIELGKKNLKEFGTITGPVKGLYNQDTIKTHKGLNRSKLSIEELWELFGRK